VGTVSEYISRNEAYQKLHDAGGCDASDEWARGYDAGITEAIDIIDNIPPADVAPVIHGRWVITHDFDDNKAAMVPLGRVVRCSICGYPENGAESKYCPHCGAKMDEEVK
jgi:hypothetical protein